jgi:2-phospho-L-lactate guanylyltransferase
MSPSAEVRHGVLVPVKPVRHAKSRLAPLGEDTRRALVSAFAADTVSAALASAVVDTVLVVTDDHALAAGVAGLGAQVIPDGASDDLNASLVQAAAELHRRRPDLSPAALCADLPALAPHELTEALTRATAHRRAFVTDADGIGTTLVAATSLTQFAPRFGPGSREMHLSGGAHAIDEVALPSLRRDVDTPEDLAAALRIGVGERTASVAAGLRL